MLLKKIYLLICIHNVLYKYLFVCIFTLEYVKKHILELLISKQFYTRLQLKLHYEANIGPSKTAKLSRNILLIKAT